MRFVTYNVEWFDALFDDAGQLIEDGNWSSRYNVTRRDQIQALGIVFTALDADAVLVVEAPDGSRNRSSTTALENFARRFGLRTRKAVTGFVNDTQQEISLMFDPAVLSAHHDPIGSALPDPGTTPRFDGIYRLDLDTDMSPDRVSWSKPPLELAIETKSGQAMRLIGVHAKSKAPHGARNDQEAMRISIENRRKQLAQCIWLRNRVEEHLAAGDALMVMGDFNDGPGLDEYEKLFGRSGVEVVLGEEGTNCLYDPHAKQVMAKRGAHPVSARFYISSQKRYMSALLDYIMVSSDLRERSPEWRIWHPFDDPICFQTPELKEALLTASDHFPVSIDIDL